MRICKELFMMLLIWIVFTTKFLFSQNVFSLNPNGISQLYWPFPNSQYQNPTTGTNGWYVTCSAGCVAPGNTDGHLGGDYYADDWNLSGTLDCGVSFLSPLTGTVIFVGGDPISGYGYNIVVQSSNDSNFAFRIAHLNSISVSNGQNVSAGQKLGEIGNTGLSQGCHAHCVLYKNITNIYSGSQTALQRLQQGLTLGVSGNANQFAAMYYFSAQNTIQNGLAKVAQGVSISPNPVNIGNNFQSTFTLQETLGASITYESIVCAIVQGSAHVVDMEVKNNVTIPANSSYQYSSSQQWRLTDPAGTYQAIARGKLAGGDWFDFLTTGVGINSKTFTVITHQIILGLTPSSEIDFGNVEVGQSKTLTLKITNQSSSTANLTLSPGNPINPFELINSMSISLSPGSEHVFSIKFVPLTSQSYNQTLYLTHNATNWSSPWTIMLKGSGTNQQVRAITISGQSIISNYGINIQVSPNDKNGNGNGSTGFIRYYYDGQSVTLTATPVSWTYYGFEKWSKNGSLYSNQRSINITVNGDAEYTAGYFNSVTHHRLIVKSSNPNSGINVSLVPDDANGSGSGSTEFSRIFSHNTSISLTAPSNSSGNSFSKWLKNGLDYSTSPYINFSMSDDYTLTAVYENVTGLDYFSNRLMEYSLIQNYPNPFNPSTTIKFSIPNSHFTSLKVYDVLGREITILVNEEKLPGSYEVKFDGSNLHSGIYLYRLQAGNFSETKKLILLK